MDMLVEQTGIDVKGLSVPYNPEKRIQSFGPRLLRFGDFVAESYEEMLKKTTEAVEKKYAPYSDAFEFYSTHGRWPDHMMELLSAKRAQVHSFRAYVDNLRKERHTEAAMIRARYEAADKVTANESMIKRVAARLATVTGPVKRLFDVDGTLTKDPNQYLRTRIPGGELVESRLDDPNGQTDPYFLLDIYEITHRNIYSQAAEMWRWAGSHPDVEVREGLDPFFERYREPKALITCSTPEFAAGVLDHIANPGEVEIWGVSDESSVAIAKSSVIALHALSDHTSPISYTGDGSSDIQALSPDVAYYYALEGKKLALALEGAGFPYFTYRDFNDILENEQEIEYQRAKIA